MHLEQDLILVGHMIADILDGLKTAEDNKTNEQKILVQVQKLIKQFPFYKL